MEFDEKYCSAFCKKHGIMPLSNQSIWHPYRFSYNFNNIDFNDSKTLFFTGIGINGTPHLLTTLQLLGIAKLAKAGCRTRIILGDFDVVLARNYSPQSTVIDNYLKLCDRIGYKQEVILQSKISNRLNNLVEISRYIQMQDFTFVREDILDYYNIKDSFPLFFSYLMIFSDLLLPIMGGDYNTVVMCCGLDESRYAIAANNILNRMGLCGQISGLYTFVPNNGINGWPQMSKSHPDSAIFLSDMPNTIIRKINNNTGIIKPLYNAFISNLWKENDMTSVNYQKDELIRCIMTLSSKWKN